MKKCLRCGGDGPFWKDKNREDGLNPYCKKCAGAANKEWTSKNIEKVRQYTKKWTKENPKKMREHQRKYRYGMTPGRYDELFASQNGRCAICGSDTPGGRGVDFHVDHDHNTGKVRGLLCTNCNHMIGIAHEETSIFSKAIKYLTRKDFT
ncbi:MAG: endonuclease VII domain-containing protein [Candidatus Berkelbacteria bacterium]|nr:endonuclease VII domain-containing protein [Candidatus Berkelbacteria bacterium]